MTNIVANGNAYSDDGSSSRDMQGGGFRQWLLPMLGDAMLQTGQGASAATQAQGIAVLASESAEASAQEAADALALVLATGSGWSPVLNIAVDGTRYVLQVADWTGGRGTKPAVGYMAATGLVPTVAGGLNIRGAVAYADLSGKPTLGTAAALDVPVAPATAATAGQVVRGDDPRLSGTLNVATMPLEARTSNTMLVKADQGKLIDFTAGGFTQTFAACATLANGFTVWLRNSSTTEVLLDPYGAETIDGNTSFYMYPGEVRQIYCDGAVLRSLVITPLSMQRSTSFDFVKPPGYRSWLIEMRGATGGGGGGGSGARVSGTNVVYSGGSGGSGSCGGRSIAQFVDAMLTSTTSFVVGAKGLGGAGATTPDGLSVSGVAGTVGTAGGATSVVIDGTTFTVPGGNPGNPGGAGTTSEAGNAGAAGTGGGYPASSPSVPARYNYLVVLGLPGSAGSHGSTSAAGSTSPAPGVAGGAAASGSLANTSGRGGNGGPGVKAVSTAPSVSQAGADGEPGLVIIRGGL